MDWLPKSNIYPGVGHHNILGEKEHKKFWIDSRFWYIIYYLDPSLATLFHESGQAPNNRVFGQYEVAQDQTHSSKDRMNSAVIPLVSKNLSDISRCQRIIDIYA